MMIWREDMRKGNLISIAAYTEIVGVHIEIMMIFLHIKDIDLFRNSKQEYQTLVSTSYHLL